MQISRRVCTSAFNRSCHHVESQAVTRQTGRGPTVAGGRVASFTRYGLLAASFFGLRKGLLGRLLS